MMLSWQQAFKWILDEGEISPYDDPRYRHLAGNYTDNHHILILNYCISYGVECIISTRFILEDLDKWPIPLMHCSTVSYRLDYSWNYTPDDSWLPPRGWHKLLIGDNRGSICDIKGQQLYQTKSDEQLPKEIGL